MHWDRLSRGESGLPAAAFIKQVLALPAGILFRHCVAGDQWPDPADPLRIDQVLLLQLARATRHLRAAWSFTHFRVPREARTIKDRITQRRHKDFIDVFERELAGGAP